MRDSTEEIRRIKLEEKIPERIGGEEERDLDLADRTKEPRLTPKEKARLQRFERPCSEEERRSTPTWLKWETLGNLKSAYHGEKKAELEVGTARVAPMSAKPPPKPQYAFSSDKVVGKGAEAGTGKTGERSDSKGIERQGMGFRRKR